MDDLGFLSSILGNYCRCNFSFFISIGEVMKVSDCCQAPCIETDYGICPDCKEHCEFVDLIEEEGEENE